METDEFRPAATKTILGLHKMVTAQRRYIGKLLGQMRQLQSYVTGEGFISKEFLRTWNVDIVAGGRACTLEYLGFVPEFLHADMPRNEDEAAAALEKLFELVPDLSSYSPRSWQYTTFHLSMILAEVLRDVSFSKERTREILDEAFERADTKVWTIDDVTSATNVDPD